jgi:hypothetical protein
MENIRTAFIFEEGNIRGFDVRSGDRDICSAMDFIQSTLKTTIENNKISGRIELTISDSGMRLAYVGIQPFKFAPVLINLINTTP